MAWIMLTVAGVLEVVWAFYMKQSHGFTRLTPSILTFVFMFASFGLLALAMKSMPMGTAYAIWTGIGAIGAVAVGIVVLGESTSPARLAGIGLVVAGLVVLKLATPD